MHLNSRLLFDRHARHLFRPGMRVLEIGPDAMPSTFAQSFGSLALTWETVDIFARPGLTHVATAEEAFPLLDNAFDIVLSGQVLEHVRKPWRWIREVARVCAPGGLVVNIIPVSWPYHEAPVDCWRIHPEGMRSLHEEAGLDTLLVVSECLEVPPGTRITPGRSAGHPSAIHRLLQPIRRALGRPSEAAIDTVAVARKPQ